MENVTWSYRLRSCPGSTHRQHHKCFQKRFHGKPVERHPRIRYLQLVDPTITATATKVEGRSHPQQDKQEEKRESEEQ